MHDTGMTTRRVLGTNIQCCKLVQLYCVPGRQLKRCRRIDVPLHCWLRSQRQRRHPDMHRLRRRHLQPGRRALHQYASHVCVRAQEAGSGGPNKVLPPSRLGLVPCHVRRLLCQHVQQQYRQRVHELPGQQLQHRRQLGVHLLGRLHQPHRPHQPDRLQW